MEIRNPFVFNKVRIKGHQSVCRVGYEYAYDAITKYYWSVFIQLRKDGAKYSEPYDTEEKAKDRLAQILLLLEPKK